MSKNLTRKGLAFGALVALGASVFAGTPAMAADSLVLAGDYTVDTTLATAITETFTLNASLAPGSTAANISQLKYKVTNNGALDVVATPYGANSSAALTAGTPVTISAADGNKYVPVINGTINPSATVKNNLKLDLSADTPSSTTQTVTVIAFLDANTNGIVDSNETQTTQTVTFMKQSEITTTTTITAPTEGDTQATAFIKFNNVNNQSMPDANVGVAFSKGDGSRLIAESSLGSNAITAGTAVASLGTGTGSLVTASIADATAAKLSVGDTIALAGETNSTKTYNGSYSVVSFGTASGGNTPVRLATTNVAVPSGTVTFSRTYTATTTPVGSATYSTTKGGWTFTVTGLDTLAKATAVKVQPLFLGSNQVVQSARAATVGTAATANVAAHVTKSLSGNTVTSVTTTAASSDVVADTTTNPSQNNNSAAIDFSKNAEYQVKFVAKDNVDPAATTAKVVAGAAVTIKITTGQTLSATAATPVTLTVNGTTYSSNTLLPGYSTTVAKLAATTDATGAVVVTIKTSGFGSTSADTVSVQAFVENIDTTVKTHAADLSYSSAYIANAPYGVAVTTDNTPVALNFVVHDQFGGNAPDGTYKVVAAWDAADTSYSAQGTTASTAATATEGTVTSGSASLTITDNGTGTGVNNYDITLQKKSTVSGLFADVSTIKANFNIKIVSAADAAAGEVVLAASNSYTKLDAASTTDTTSILPLTSAGGSTGPGSPAARTALVTAAFGNYDSRAVITSAPAAVATVINVFGTVNSATTTTYAGIAIPNAVVKISGAGMLFRTAGGSEGTLYGDGSLSLYTDASGHFNFWVASHLAGKQTVTVTSGAGTQKLYVYFAEALQQNASTVTVTVADGASQFQAGRALDVTVKVADKFGNPIALTGTAGTTAGKLVISQTGAGYLSDSDSAGTTSATGTFSSKLITNAGDLGTSTITATVDFDNSTTLVDLVANNSSEFGVTDADVTVGGRAIYASAEYAKGKTVTVSVDGKRLYSKLQTTDNYTELKFTQKTAGKHVVTVRVSGGVVVSETVVTTK